jgi:hypothetical protein
LIAIAISCSPGYTSVRESFNDLTAKATAQAFARAILVIDALLSLQLG